MNFSQRLRLSRFILSCVFLTGYTAYTVYAVYYYTRFEDSRIGGTLLGLIGAALALSVFITIVSYRINLMDKARPKLHRFVKMTKYLLQLIASAITIFLVISTVQNTSVFSLIMSAISIPFLIWSFFVNVFAELLEHALGGFGKKVYIRTPPVDEEGSPEDVRALIRSIDGHAHALEQMKKKQEPPKN